VKTERAFALLASPAAPLAAFAALAWAPATGFPTWVCLSRARFAGTLLISAVVACATFVLAERLAALAAN